jgi:hypothetical protein
MRLPQLGMQSAEPCRVSVPAGCAQPPPAALPGIVSFASFDGGVVAMPDTPALLRALARLTPEDRQHFLVLINSVADSYDDGPSLHESLPSSPLPAWGLPSAAIPSPGPSATRLPTN